MGDAKPVESKSDRSIGRLLLLPLWVISWPFVKVAKGLDRHFLAYVTGRTLRDRDRIYSIKFVWYSDSIYLHPLVWGSLILYFVARTEVLPPGWPLLVWFIGLGVCFLTIMYNFDVIRVFVLVVGVVAVLGAAYFSTVELAWNPLSAVSQHIRWLEAAVTPGFYVASSYLFTALIFSEVVWAWLFHRVEIDESYVYEHAFLQGSTREPIFARGMKRSTKDLLELLILGAADIEHKTKTGAKRFKNVPFASLWLGTAIDSMLDYRRKGELEIGKRRDDEAEQTRLEDAFHEADDWGHDDDDDDVLPDDTDDVDDGDHH